MSVTIIAEAGINYNGDMTMAKELILRAKGYGADVWKTQLYSATTLFGPEGATPNPDIYKQIKWMDDIGFEQAAQMKEWCDEAGIEFMASAFDEERLNWLERLDVKRHKLASRSVKYQWDYCQKVLALGKETFVSLGMWNSLGSAFDFPFSPMGNIRYLYCVSEYPTPLSHLKLPAFFISEIKFHIGGGIVASLGKSEGYIGFSDHTLGINAALVAVARGAQVIEKHFTLDHALPGPDHKCSANYQEMRELIWRIREFEKVVERRD